MTDKRYQVFVSSTYADLIDARSEVIQALLELNCMPAGMELFPAANDDQWQWIKRVIDESDYYIVIIAGRYGSISKATGQSYTEMEYRYALETQKPVIAFIHKNPEQLPAKVCEQTEQGRAQLTEFRELVQRKLCKFWTDPSDLGAKVSRSITQLIKQYPAIGWIRADEVDIGDARETLAMRKQIDDLSEKLHLLEATGPTGANAFAGGNEKFLLEFYYEIKLPKTGKQGQTYFVKGSEGSDSINLSWDDVFRFLSPHLLEPNPERNVMQRLNSYVEAKSTSQLQKKHSGCQIVNLTVYGNAFKELMIQYRALGLIDVAEGKWMLTDYGDKYMTRLLAQPKKALRPAAKKRVRK